MRGRMPHFTGVSRDLLSRQPGYFCGPLWCFVFELEVPPGDNTVGVYFFKHFLIDFLSGHKAVFAVGKIANEVFVPEPFGEQNMSEGHRQGTVRTGFERQPLIGLGRSRRQPRFNYGDVCAVNRFTPGT